MRRLFFVLTIAAFGTAARADDESVRAIPYRPNEQTTIVCPAGLLCAIRLQRGERIRDGLNSQAGAWEPHAIYEGELAQTPLVAFRPQAPGLRANVILTTNRRTYLVMLESDTSDRPTYVRFTYPEEERTRTRVVARARPAPRPLTVSEQFEAACSWMTSNAPNEGYDADAQPIQWRPARMCHDARQTWFALAPLPTVATDFPVLLELTSAGERIVNYTVFAAERLIRIDGVGDGYVLRSGPREAMHVHRLAQAPRPAPASSPAASPAPVSLMTSTLPLMVMP